MNGMKRIAGVALACLACVWGCGRPAETERAPRTSEAEEHVESKEGSERVTITAEVRAASRIEVAPAASRLVREELELPGEILPNADQLAHVVPRFPGIAREVRKRLGDAVRAGEVLAVIEGNQSLSTYDVRSLISGTVIEKHLTLGEFVRDDQDIYVVADLSSVWVNISIYARDVSRIRVGQPVRVQAVGSSSTGEGRVDYLDPVVGEATRAGSARVVLANPSARWRPGTFVTARITVAEHKAAVAVPAMAVQSVEGRDCVFVEDGDGFVARPVTLGRTDGAWTEIVSGLERGTRVVTVGAFLIKSELQKSEAGHDH
jgi:cobalt-zinc-cadmium efflux system membrane fusion protein